MSQAEYTLTVPAELAQLEALRQFFEDVAADLRLEQEPTLDLLVALSEVATNSILHGYRGAPGTLELRVRPAGPDLVLTLRDHAPLFDPTAVPPPRTDLPLELRPPGGMGLLLTRHYTDELRHRPAPDGANELTLVKRGVLTTPQKENPGGADS
jgi:serine/threonine-protein kinase RsbW